ncbi:MAG: DUF1330 domain-containing protein [Myxococcota bacterium]
MNVENQVVPSMERLQEFFGPGAPSGAFVMVNMLKFKEKAEYADGRETTLSGTEAYMAYAAEVVKLVEKHGGRQIYGGVVTGLMLGEVEELWDMIALVEYPSNEAFQQMMQSPEYQEVHVHRDAGLAGQLNIRIQGSAGA